MLDELERMENIGSASTCMDLRILSREDSREEYSGPADAEEGYKEKGNCNLKQ